MKTTKEIDRMHRTNRALVRLVVALTALLIVVVFVSNHRPGGTGSCYDQLADNDRVARIATATGQLPGHVRQHGLHNEELPFGSKFAVTENPCVQKI